MVRTLLVRLLVLGVVPLALLIGPAAVDGSRWSGVAPAPAAHAAPWCATARCQVVCIDPFGVVGTVEGVGSGPSPEIARRAALRDANAQVPAGHYKRHCKVTVSRGGG